MKNLLESCFYFISGHGRGWAFSPNDLASRFSRPREVTQKKPKTPPKGIKKPITAEEMQAALIELIPIERRDDIAVIVLDLTRMK